MDREFRSGLNFIAKVKANLWRRVWFFRIHSIIYSDMIAIKTRWNIYFKSKKSNHQAHTSHKLTRRSHFYRTDMGTFLPRWNFWYHTFIQYIMGRRNDFFQRRAEFFENIYQVFEKLTSFFLYITFFTSKFHFMLIFS